MDAAQGGFGRLCWSLDVKVDLLNRSLRLRERPVKWCKWPPWLSVLFVRPPAVVCWLFRGVLCQLADASKGMGSGVPGGGCSTLCIEVSLK